MKYIFLLPVFFCLSLSAQRDTLIGSVKCHLVASSADTGTAWIQRNVKKKKGEFMQGAYFEFYPGGKLKVKGWYKKGKRNQAWKKYYADGKIAYEGYFKEGMKSDLWKFYYPNGNLEYRGMYYEDIHAGFCYHYYENGVLKSKTRYVIITFRVKSDERIKRPGQHFKSRVEVHNSVSPVDSIVEYYPTGKLKSRIMYDKAGRLNGTSDFYYENGQKNCHGNYVNGVKSGEWNYYCLDGGMMKTISFDEKGGTKTTNSELKSDCGYSEMVPGIQWTTEVYPPMK